MIYLCYFTNKFYKLYILILYTMVLNKLKKLFEEHKKELMLLLSAFILMNTIPKKQKKENFGKLSALGQIAGHAGLDIPGLNQSSGGTTDLIDKLEEKLGDGGEAALDAIISVLAEIFILMMRIFIEFIKILYEEIEKEFPAIKILFYLFIYYIFSPFTGIFGFIISLIFGPEYAYIAQLVPFGLYFIVKTYWELIINFIIEMLKSIDIINVAKKTFMVFGETIGKITLGLTEKLGTGLLKSLI
jgi:hypothetical protein